MSLKPNVSGKNLTRGILLFAIIAGLFIVGTSATITAQLNTTEEEGQFFDPFDLSMMTAKVAPPVRPTTPIPTLREWIRIPYSPPVRSPFMPAF
ncbi:MAG: hypothetical protein IH624_03365 [Phycisphaerae bacterium]|nr:hypothetical protein [Phycisphaerae bacterium]